MPSRRPSAKHFFAGDAYGIRWSLASHVLLHEGLSTWAHKSFCAGVNGLKVLSRALEIGSNAEGTIVGLHLHHPSRNRADHQAFRSPLFSADLPLGTTRL